jgi:4-amino-4-deoxy-L-arabinose transferase-like glycosyltransferase
MTDITAEARSVSGGRLRTLVRGREDDPAWVRPTLLGLLAGTALLYLVGLSANGWANSYYSAAVQAATQSWKAFFFGSFDSSNFITVDKPPASLWVMDASARIFGVSSWSILVPQALEGVAAVGLLYATVRRQFTAAAGLIAGLVMALTPVAALMFRFNNPDALLTLLLLASAYSVTRALQRGSTWWLVAAGSFVGFAFLTKMLQALIVVPGFALVYLVAAPTPLRRRLLQLLAAGAAIVVSAGWWVAIVALWPAASRPYIGSSQDNSILSLTFGYNGFGRLTGNESGSVIGGQTFGTGGNPAPRGGMWGPTGITRLFNDEMGTQVSWLIPAALIGLVGLLWVTRRARRTDGVRAAALLWGSWLVVTGIVFSFAAGIIHPYYNVVLAPAIGGLVGIGAVRLWQDRGSIVSRLLLAAAVALSGVWAFELLGRTPDWQPWLRYVVLVAASASALAILALPLLGSRPRVALAIATVALAALLAAPLAYSAQTASTPHSGAIPSAGPGGRFGGFGGGPRTFRRAFGNGGFRGGPPSGVAPSGNGGLAPPGGTFGQGGGFGQRGGGFGPGGGFGRPGGSGGLGGLLDASTPSKQLVTLLEHAGSYRWAAAAVGANSAAGVQIASGKPILAIGGFNGSDPTPTLAQFKQLVAAGQIHYFLANGGGGFGRRSGSTIQTWVAAHFSSRTVGGVTVYDLTARTS